MFNGNVTQTYNFQDASYEIIFMLLGAFLLGCLLTWLLQKLFNRDYTLENNEYRYEYQGDDEINTLKQSHNLNDSSTGEVKIVDAPTQQQTKIVTPPDDLTKISAIDSDMLSHLNKLNIKSFKELSDINTKDLKAIQNKQNTNKRIIDTWPHQASLAAKGEWAKLKDYQGFIHRVQVASKTEENVNQNNFNSTQSDLSKIVGIDSEIERILNNNEIYSYKQLSHIDGEILKSHLVKANSKYADHETDSWSHQAAMADKEQWEELKVYQDFMHSDSDVNVADKDTTFGNNVVSRSDIDDTDETNEFKKQGILETEHLDAESSDTEDSDENLSDHDDLKKIEGIGPKIEEVLNKGGIYTYSQLYNSNRERLKSLLDDAGSQFRLHKPDSWPHQAGMANRGEWEELNTYQQTLIQEQALEAKKVAKTKSKKRTKSSDNKKLSVVNKKDNLRKIEGIGPKIEELLNNAGIETFKALSVKSRDAIKELLNEAGPQFRMHEPESWPHQAKLAADDKWDELEEYQDFLNGGRE